MSESFLFFNDAKQKLENDMADLQRRFVRIRTGQSESSALECLEYEIDDHTKAIESLDAQSRCDRCKVPVDNPQMLRFRITKSKYKESMVSNAEMKKIRIRAECPDCCRSATPDEIRPLMGPASQNQDLVAYAHRLMESRCKGRVRSGDELLQEALAETFFGHKKWYTAHVDFFGHLLKAMENIAWRWCNESQKEIRESDSFKQDDEGETTSLLESALRNKAQSSDPSAALIAKIQVQRLLLRFSGDQEATVLLHALTEGATTAREIMLETKLSNRRVEAAWRRIRSGKSILIIEEYIHMLDLLALWLKPMDYAVVPASATADGLRLYRECGPFDVVIISHLPSGVELAMKIRKTNPSQKIIFTTTYSSGEDIRRPNELGDIPILLKPFIKTELCAVLRVLANTITDKLPNCFRPKRRNSPATRKNSATLRASGLPKRWELRGVKQPS